MLYIIDKFKDFNRCFIQQMKQRYDKYKNME